MVLAGLYNMGDVPFHEVYITPKILDGYGETMSKSKGNGVDPLDVIDKFGADALRFGLAYLTTETQDVQLPVEFECPHCQAPVRADEEEPPAAADRMREVRQAVQHAVGREAGGQGAAARGRGQRAVRAGPQLRNKLWNAARFSLINLEGYTPGPVADEDLLLEDRWLLSRLGDGDAASDRRARTLPLRRRGPHALRLRLERVLQLLRGDDEGPVRAWPSSGKRRSACWPTRSTCCCGCCIR